MTSTLSYHHRDYAASFHDCVEPLHLKHCDGWLLRRQINDSRITDLSSPYPMFSCTNLSLITTDLAELDTTYTASMVLRTDAFKEAEVVGALSGFDEVRPFKTHHIANLDQPWRSYARRTCRRNAASAQNSFEIRHVEQPANYAGLLSDLNKIILQRHNIPPSNLLSKEELALQLALPGVSLFEARNEQGTQALACFMEVGDYAYAYLLGATVESRRQSVIYGLYGYALDYYQDKIHAIDFGSNAGTSDNSDDGLSQFKRGWCNQTMTSYLCGKILNSNLYQELCDQHNFKKTSFFPAYRTPQNYQQNQSKNNSSLD